ncbi:hypothetical protein [Streptomyces sp. NPDC012616]|uniref:hypothetical protein n=1 Tax=Streptomyces sp. NPDC012616 TaxID=3364840 RepID=UPI0036EAB202
MALMALELDILHSVPEAGALKPMAYAVWTDRDGEVQMGPVRARHVQSSHEGAGMYYECSPFPGAWDRHVPEERIMRVRHLQAMSLRGADDVK